MSLLTDDLITQKVRLAARVRWEGQRFEVHITKSDEFRLFDRAEIGLMSYIAAERSGLRKALPLLLGMPVVWDAPKTKVRLICPMQGSLRGWRSWQDKWGNDHYREEIWETDR
jgi:hypothetical protein